MLIMVLTTAMKLNSGNYKKIWVIDNALYGILLALDIVLHVEVWFSIFTHILLVHLRTVFFKLNSC